MNISPEEFNRLRAELAQRSQDLADTHADREQLKQRLAKSEASPLAWAEQLDAKSLDNFLIALGSATEHEPLDGAIDRIHELIRSFREALPTADGITKRIAPTQALREDIPEDSPAALLALKLRTSQPDVVSTEVLGAQTLRITIKPQSLDCWNWWQRRFNVDVHSVTSRGSVATATGQRNGVTLHFAAEGVPAMQAAASRGEDQ